MYSRYASLEICLRKQKQQKALGKLTKNTLIYCCFASVLHLFYFVAVSLFMCFVKPSTNEGRMHVATYISIYKWYLPANRQTPETFATAAETSRVRRSRCITQKNQLKHDKQLKMQLLRPALLFWFAQVFLHTYTTAVGRRKKQTPAIVVNFTCWKLIVLFLLSWQLNANSAETTLVAQLLYIRTAGACCFRFHIFTFLHFCISQLKTTLDQLQFNRGSKSTWTLPLRVPK